MACDSSWLLAAVDGSLVRPSALGGIICKDSGSAYVKNRMAVMNNWLKEAAGDNSRVKAFGGSMESGMTRGAVITAMLENKNSITISRSLSQEAKIKCLRNGQTSRFVLALVMSALVTMLAVSRLKLLVVPWSASSTSSTTTTTTTTSLSSFSSPTKPLHLMLSNQELNPPLHKHSTHGAHTTGDKANPSLTSKVKLQISSPIPSRPQLASSSSVDKACKSRSQQQMYRDYAHQFPRSALLDHALEDYTKMHSQCAFSEDGCDSDTTVPSAAKQGCQYVVYLEGYEGLGNRLLSLVSAFAYAMVTHRALVIDGRRGHLAQLLCEPFHNSSWLLPPGFAESAVLGASTMEDAMRWNFKNVTSVRINLRHKQTQGDRTFFCPASQRGLCNITWIWWESNQYFIPRLFMIPPFWSLLSSWFPDPSLVFTQLTRFLCLPQNHIWAQIKRIHASYLASSMMQVGLQVRRHKTTTNATLALSVGELIMNCSLKHHLLPKPAVLQPKEQQQLTSKNFTPAAGAAGAAGAAADFDDDETLASSGRSSTTFPSTVAVLVTSLQIEYYETLRDLYVEHGAEDGTVVSVHMVSHEGVENYLYEQAMKALTEIWLLSFSNKLATSAWSTFGYVAQGLGGLQPIILNFLSIDSPNEMRPTCTLGQSIDPCLHYPFVKQSKCGKLNMSRQQSQWISTHVRSCQDEFYGLQLC